MHPHHITILGCGNMGTSLLGGLLKNGFQPHQITVSHPSLDALNTLHTQFGVQTCQDNVEAAKKAKVIILAVKPHLIQKIALEIASTVQDTKPLFISVAAGISLATLEKCLGKNQAIIRAMPNTPALVGYGATGLYANSQTSAALQQLADRLLKTVGITAWVKDEKLIDVITALSGSGPAYFFLIMEAMQKAAEHLGLPQEMAKQLTVQTCLGAAQIALHSNKSIEELRKNVTSPGGTTEQAIRVLEQASIQSTFEAALTAAKNQSEKLSQLAE